MAEPHYARMKSFIRDRIAQGALKPGDRVPSEHELVAQFSVSRMTANRALKELAAEGLVTRRSGSGTFVAEAKATSPAPATAATAAGPQPDLADIEAVVKGHGHRYSRRVEQSRTLQASPVLMDAFGLATPQPISHHVLLHPFNWKAVTSTPPSCPVRRCMNRRRWPTWPTWRTKQKTRWKPATPTISPGASCASGRTSPASGWSVVSSALAGPSPS